MCNCSPFLHHIRCHSYPYVFNWFDYNFYCCFRLNVFFACFCLFAFFFNFLYTFFQFYFSFTFLLIFVIHFFCIFMKKNSLAIYMNISHNCTIKPFYTSLLDKRWKSDIETISFSLWQIQQRQWIWNFIAKIYISRQHLIHHK